MTRKQRKQIRKRKAILTPEDEAWCREMAVIITKNSTRRQDQGVKYFCPVCWMPYCIDFLNKDAFCRTCHYKLGCIKETARFETCDYCKKEDANA